MYHLILLVLDKVEQSRPVLDSWVAAGVSGVTILESTGLAGMRESAIRDDLPLMPSIESLLVSREEHHRTFFTVVDDEALIDRIIEATEAITGDLDEAERGVLFVWPVARAVGLHGALKRAQDQE